MWKFHILAEKGHICFYKNFTNQTFTIFNSKVVYFRSVWNIKYSTLKKRSFQLEMMLHRVNQCSVEAVLG